MAAKRVAARGGSCHIPRFPTASEFSSSRAKSGLFAQLTKSAVFSSPFAEVDGSLPSKITLSVTESVRVARVLREALYQRTRLR